MQLKKDIKQALYTKGTIPVEHLLLPNYNDNMANIPIKQIRKNLFDYFKSPEDYHPIKPTGLANPDIPVTFNPSAGFLQIRDMLYNSKPNKEEKFYVNEKCFRFIDSSSVGVSNRHLSFFEMFAFFICGHKVIEYDLIKNIIKILTQILNLEKKRIYITLFSGGSVANLHNIPHEYQSMHYWLSAGISQQNIFLTNGLRNFVANFQWRYAGSTTEIFYLNPHNELIEIGSINKYRFGITKTTRHAEDVFKLFDVVNHAYGVGLGLERLGMVVNQKQNIFGLTELDNLIQIVLNKIDTSLDAIRSLDMEHVKQIVDNIRSIAFIMSEGVRPSRRNSQGKILKKVIQNMLEELNYLGLYDCKEKIIKDLAQEVQSQYEGEYLLKINSCLSFLKKYFKQVEIKKKYSHLMDGASRT